MDRHMERINDHLGVVYRRGGFEAVDTVTPVDAIEPEEDSTDQQKVRDEAFRKLLGYFFEDGPHPGVVMRRVYATAWALAPEMIGHMSQRDLAKLFDETPAAVSWRVKKMFDGYLAAAGMRGRLAGQKSDSARASYSRAQRGNKNRKCGKRRRNKS